MFYLLIIFYGILIKDLLGTGVKGFWGFKDFKVKQQLFKKNIFYGKKNFVKDISKKF